MQGAIFYSSILAFTSGIFVGSFFLAGWFTIAWLGLLTLVLGLWWYQNKSAVRSAYLLIAVVIFGCFTFGLARLELAATLATPLAFEDQVGQKVTLTGIVITEPVVTAKSTQLTVLVAGKRVLVSTDRYATVVYGDEISFSGKLQKPESFETEFGRTFNYPGYLAVRDIFYTVSFANITVIQHGQGNKVLSALFSNKQVFLESIQTYIPEPEVGLGSGLLLGVKSSLGDDLEAAFRATGIIHIVVLSGANIMLVVVFVMYVLALLIPVRPRAVVGIVAIVLFALLVGLSATVVRASIMAILILGALLFGKKYAITRALFFAGGLMLLVNPLLLVFDVGFQLSFLATLGLILVAPQFELMLSGVPSAFKLKEYFLATVATQVAILPLLLYQIGQFSVVAILVNMLVLPLVPLAMLTTFIAGIVGLFVPALGVLVGFIAYLFLTYIVHIATWFAALPFAVVVIPAFPLLVVFMLYAGIGLMFYYWSRRSFPMSAIDLSTMAHFIIEEEAVVAARVQASERSLRERSDNTKIVKPIFFR